MSERCQGVIVRMLFLKGFGFVRKIGDPDTVTYFMHVNDVKPRLAFDTMHEGQVVEFTPSPSDKGNGLCAKDVTCPS